MITRRHGFGLGTALSLASFYLSFTTPALAQDPVPPPATDAPAPADAKPPEEVKPAEAPAGTPAVEPPKDEKAVEATVPPPTPMPAPSPTTASGTSVEREKTVSFVGLEMLPGSAYPSVQTRGIKYGSMWLTFHGQQWPYMPLIEGGPGMRIGISGYVWNDLSYARVIPGKELQAGRQNRWMTETRGALRVTPTYNWKDGWFAQAEGEFILHGDMTLPTPPSIGTTDDLWVRAGKWGLFDIQVGRFQGWEIANHFGMGLDQNTLERNGAVVTSASVKQPPSTYGLTYFWDRQDVLMGGYAAHVYPTKFLRGELLGHIGEGVGTGSPRQLDVRPAAIFDIGYVKLKAGWEYGKTKPMDENKKERYERNGYGLAAQFVLAPWVEGGFSYAHGFEEKLTDKSIADLNGSGSTYTYGGFINGSPGWEPLVLGAGLFETHQEDMRWDPKKQGVGTNDQTQWFGAVQYTLWNQLYIKFVFSHANNRVNNAGSGHYSNNQTGGRLRVMLLF